MNQNKEFLGTQPIGKLLLHLAIPTVVAQLINMLYNVVDRIYIGNMPGIGSLALTGVGVCLPLIMIISAFSALIGYGGAPLASISLGRKEPEKAKKILNNSFRFLIVIALTLTVILLFSNRFLLYTFGASEQTIGYALDYMNIYSIGTIFVEVTLGMNAFITAQGFTKAGMYSVLIGAVTNIVLDPILIYGLNMGVKGAAIATIASQALSCIYVISFLHSKHSNIHLELKPAKISFAILKPCLILGVSGFVMQASESIIIICFNSSLQAYGGDLAVGAMTILSTVMQFALLPLNGLGQGAQPIISYNYGAGNKQRVISAFKLLLKISLTYSLTLWALIEIFPSIFVRIFTNNEELLIFATKMIRIYVGGLGLFGAQVACQMVFTSIGDAKASIIAAVMRKFILLIPLIYLIPLLVSNKTMGVYLAEPVADIIAVIFTVTLFYFHFKAALNKMEPAHS